MSIRVAAAVLSLCLIGAGACGHPSGDSSDIASSGAGDPPAPPSPPVPPTPPAGTDPAALATQLPASQIRASLPPLPMVSFAPPRPPDVVRTAYEFAALHPEVLKYVPCFCGCEQSGHQHNESCFVSRRAADGRILEWDDHGLG